MAEIQAAGEFVEGRLKNWAWIEGPDNPADWTTKTWLANELKQGGFWQNGPDFLSKDIWEWPIKLLFHTDVLEGELSPKTAKLILLIMMWIS